jgi:uncharacterized damage-inducible protein DinB
MLTELRELFAYDRWANERILAACEPLSPEELTRALGGSFPSVWLTLTHIYGAENTWFARWLGVAQGRLPELDGVTTVDALRERWRALWSDQDALFATLTDERARASIEIQFRDGRRMSQQLGATMRHAVNHSTYHRGQVVNFLRMLGKSGVGTDLVTYYSEHSPQ